MNRTRDAEVIEGELAAVPAELNASQLQVYTPPANPFDADPQRFAVQVQQRGQNYEHLIAWLCDHLVVGEDMVQVHFVGKNKCRHGGPQRGCTPSTDPDHWSDPDLSKRGAEKICGLLGLGARFLGMEDFRKAALSGVDLKQIIIDCEIYGSSGTAMSQGTGSCSLEEMYGDLNGAMKRAAKRAYVDALKRVAGLSGLATELKRRMPPVDPEGAKRKAEAAIRKPVPGADSRWNTGATLTHVPFGKNKGKLWRELETRALEWYVQNLGDKPDLVRAAAGELSKRQSTANSSTRNPSPPGIPPDPEFEDDIPF